MIGNIVLLFLILLLLFPIVFSALSEGSETASSPKEVHLTEDESLQHPYRQAAKLDEKLESEINYLKIVAHINNSYLHKLNQQLSKIKEKKIVMPKSVAVFLYLVPAMLTDIGLGFIYDSNTFGTGFKWGCFAAAFLINIFFIVTALAKADPA